MANDILSKEAEEFEKRTRQVEKAFKALDDAFQKWKEGVLKFEHFKLGINDCIDNDNRICDGECVRASEDESDIQ